MITLLNTSIITDYGRYLFVRKSLEEIKTFVAGNEIQSAIGHEATAEILTELLEFPVPFNRINYIQQVGDSAVVFKLKQRMPEGVILSREEIEKIGYDFGILTRLE